MFALQNVNVQIERLIQAIHFFSPDIVGLAVGLAIANEALVFVKVDGESSVT